MIKIQARVAMFKINEIVNIATLYHGFFDMSIECGMDDLPDTTAISSAKGEALWRLSSPDTFHARFAARMNPASYRPLRD